MANNRMFLKCNKCDEVIMLTKNFGCIWNEMGLNKLNEINEFLNNHFGCDDSKGYIGDAVFSIVYEHVEKNNNFVSEIDDESYIDWLKNQNSKYDNNQEWGSIK